MNNDITRQVNDLKNIKLISLILIILFSSVLGCVNAPVRTPTPTETPTATLTVLPTIMPTIPIPTPTPTIARVSVFYYSDVDNYYGFPRIVSNSSRPVKYDVYNRTITINSGDSIIWINDATSPEEKLTIVNEEGLWTNNTRAILRWNRAQFNYTFSQPGTYGVYIKEYPRFQHLKIIVTP
ncbi:MAG: hypothetical protein O8C66_01350 [Candidatus Methanoperedens sp.]|nr:hypothetical protein [Candidatus Methanoperedens sp.]MCZ7369134.1 hypothetical protein [Candidatus Methanoperedens sp.]